MEMIKHKKEKKKFKDQRNSKNSQVLEIKEDKRRINNNKMRLKTKKRIILIIKIKTMEPKVKKETLIFKSINDI
jgi:hypothetical protein